MSQQRKNGNPAVVDADTGELILPSYVPVGLSTPVPALDDDTTASLDRFLDEISWLYDKLDDA